jgi:hypothetical protein
MAIYSQTSGVLSLGTLSAVGVGPAVGFPESASIGPVGQSYSLFNTQVNITGGPATVSVQLQGSLDGTNWFSIGAANTGTATNVAGPLGTANQAFAYVRANLGTLTGGTNPTVTVFAVAVS